MATGSCLRACMVYSVLKCGRAMDVCAFEREGEDGTTFARVWAVSLWTSCDAVFLGGAVFLFAW